MSQEYLSKVLREIFKKISGNKIMTVSWLLILFGAIISVYFVISAFIDGFNVFGSQKIDFPTTGQFGDFLGGVVGTVFTLAGTFLIYLSFTAQNKQNKRESFESKFFLMINLHRENVSELNYTKFDNGKLRTGHHRKVFRMIFREFEECFDEVKSFYNSKATCEYLLLPEYRQTLEKIIKENESQVSPVDFALVDIAYSIIFFGVGKEGESILKERFKIRYKNTDNLLKHIKKKPKQSESEEIKDKKSVKNLESWLKVDNNSDFKNQNKGNSKKFTKYYGGHQHRLGHYFRHLFQSYKYLNYNDDLSKDEKYFYGKTLRAQLSTYEQALFFVNSVSSLGMKWEFMPEDGLLSEKENKNNSKLITRYHLIKNLPGYHLSGLQYKQYYPHVKYEANETNEQNRS